MTINNATTSFMATGILDVRRGTRGAVAVRVPRRAAARWPWPLPMDSVLAVLDGDRPAPEMMRALRGAGVGPGETWAMSGEDGAGELRSMFTRRGALARLRSLLGGEDEIVAQLEEWCARGGTALLVRTPRGRTDSVIEIVVRHGARRVRRTGRWVSTWAVLRA